MSASARYKLTNYTFYATAIFAFAVVSFGTMLPCPARGEHGAFARLQEEDDEVQQHQKALQQSKRSDQGAARSGWWPVKKRRWIEDPAPVQKNA